MIEEWRSVDGWGGLYEVSSHGRVRSLDRIVRCGYGRTRRVSGRILKPAYLHGYPRVILTLAGRPLRQVFVHQLVCEAFCGPRPTLQHEVAHRDGNAANAHYLNLRWATHRENEADKVRHGTAPRGENHGGAKLDWKKVKEIRSLSGTHDALASRFGVTRRTVGRIRNGLLWREAGAA